MALRRRPGHATPERLPRCELPAATKDDDRARLDDDLLARGERELALLELRLGRRELELPARAEPADRQLKGDRLEVRVEEEQERLVDDLLAARRGRRDLFAVEEDANRV